jgi:hypothetical protein
MSDPRAGAPIEPAAGVNPVVWLALRTVLLALSIVILFPRLLDPLTQGAWSRLLLSMGEWRWAAWGACFVAMMVVRFVGAPKRG